MTSGSYTISTGAVAAPTFSVASGRYLSGKSVVISTATSGATIHYTTNGADPTASDPTIASGGTLTVDRAMVVKAAAWKSGMTTSAVTRGDYFVTGAVVAGAGFVLVLKTDGTVYGWGSNTNGQLGNGTTTTTSTPVQASGLSGVVAIAAGTAHSLALKSDGTVYAWGLNTNGQIGDGTTTQRTSPVQISGLSGVVAIAAGASFSLAVKSDGTARAWGLNTNGQLGDDTTTQRTSPVTVTGLTGAVGIAAGATHSLALLSNSTVKAWGYNGNGQIGDNSQTQRKIPVAVAQLSGVTSLEGGTCFSLATTGVGVASSKVYSWGCGAFGQLGDGTTTASRLTPGRAADRGYFVVGGAEHGLGLGADGRVAVWGRNNFFQLGLTLSSQPRPTPQVLESVSEVLQVAAGTDFSAALRADGTRAHVGIERHEPARPDGHCVQARGRSQLHRRIERLAAGGHGPRRPHERRGVPPGHRPARRGQQRRRPGGRRRGRRGIGSHERRRGRRRPAERRRGGPGHGRACRGHRRGRDRGRLGLLSARLVTLELRHPEPVGHDRTRHHIDRTAQRGAVPLRPQR